MADAVHSTFVSRRSMLKGAAAVAVACAMPLSVMGFDPHQYIRGIRAAGMEFEVCHGPGNWFFIMPVGGRGFDERHMAAFMQLNPALKADPDGAGRLYRALVAETGALLHRS